MGDLVMKYAIWEKHIKSIIYSYNHAEYIEKKKYGILIKVK